MAQIEIQEVKTRIYHEDNEYILDAAIWPQCGFEFPVNGGSAKASFQSAVMGSKVTSVNLVFTDDKTAFIDVQL
jgi:hypothetical protein